MSQGTERLLSGGDVLKLLLAFFGVMFAVNGVFLYFALATFDGPAEKDAYATGLHYNARIEAARRQAALGLRHELRLADDGTLRLLLRDAHDAPAAGLTLSGTIGRPASNIDDRNITLAETEPGTYEASPRLTPGAWIVELSARRTAPGHEETVYQLKERLWLTPRH